MMLYTFYADDSGSGESAHFTDLDAAIEWCEDAIDECRDAATYDGEWPPGSEDITIHRVLLGVDCPFEDGDLVYTSRLVRCEPFEPDGEVDEDGYDEAGTYWHGIDGYFNCQLCRVMPSTPSPEEKT
jgi:hypothetical protein